MKMYLSQQALGVLRLFSAVYLNRRAARDSPGICHFSFLSNFHEQMFYSENILRRKIFRNV